MEVEGAAEHYEDDGVLDDSQEEGEESEDSDESEDECYRVDGALMTEVKRFYDKDKDVQICRARKRDELAFTATAHIAWWAADQALRLVPHLNTPTYLARLEAMLWKAQDYLSLFHFCCFYYERDMDAWYRAVYDCPEEEETPLPFGLLELGLARGDLAGHFVLRRRANSPDKRLDYVCYRRRFAARYAFYVCDDGAVLEQLSRDARGYEKGAQLVAVSPFTSLYTDKRYVGEAKVCQMDANLWATHPEPFLFSKLLPDPELDQQPEETRFADDDLAQELRQLANARRINVATQAGEREIARLNSRAQKKRTGGGSSAACLTSEWEAFRDGDSDDDEGDSLFQERLEEFGRPSLKSMLRPLPASMQISRGPPPAVLVRPEELQRAYEDDVCNLMNFPHLFFKPHTSPNSRAGLTESELRHAELQLRKTLAQQRRTFELLFHQLYGRTYGLLDACLFDALAVRAPELRRLEVRARLRFITYCTKCGAAFFAESVAQQSLCTKCLLLVVIK